MAKKKSFLIGIGLVLLLFVISVSLSFFIFSGYDGGSKTVKVGDLVSANYIVRLEGGEVYDTTYEALAKENRIYNPDRPYGPVNFTVSTGMMIEGLEEGIVGMKEGETKTLVIPPEKAYGPVNGSLVEHLPIEEEMPYKHSFPKRMTSSVKELERWFGKNHTVGESLFVPSAGYNISLLSMNATHVTVSYELKEGDVFKSSKGNWNQTVLEVGDENITTAPDFLEGDTIQIYKYYWNSTVTNVSDNVVTVSHNPIPDIEFTDIFGFTTKTHFSDTEIIKDHNHLLAGKTLIFEVTVEEIGYRL
jgi:FKBP-type peptidyl-prolyl cis-trans isomerase 2